MFSYHVRKPVAVQASSFGVTCEMANRSVKRSHVHVFMVSSAGARK